MSQKTDDLLARHEAGERAVVFEILEDVLDSVKLACDAFDQRYGLKDQVGDTSHDEVYLTVYDYVANNYGE